MKESDQNSFSPTIWATGSRAARRARASADGSRSVVGLMMESFLVDGTQEVIPGHESELVYGQSITDACMGWERTEPLFGELAQAVRDRRG